MKKFKFIAVTVALIIFAALFSGCGSSKDAKPADTAAKAGAAAPPAKKIQLRVGGSTTGTWIYGFSAAWAEVINQKVPEVSLVVQATAGSSSHYAMLQRDELDFGTGSTSSEYAAINGGFNFKEKFTNFAVLMPVTTSVGHIFVLADSPIQKQEDLDGKKVAIGARGSPTSVVAEMTFEAIGVKPKYVTSTVEEMMEMLRDKRVDAGAYYVGSPFSQMLDLSSSTPIRLIPFTDAHLEKAKAKIPFFANGTITEKDYNWLKAPVPTLKGYQTMIVNPKVPEDIVYKISKATWENYDAIVKSVPAFGKVTANDVVNLYGKVHPGAAKYYQEKGVKIPDSMK